MPNFKQKTRRTIVELITVYFISIVLCAISVYIALPTLTNTLVYISIIILPLILGAAFALIHQKKLIDASETFAKTYLIDFSTKNYNEGQSKNWTINYLVASYIYFAIFFIYFYYIPHKTIIETITFAWLGVIVLRFIHYTKHFEFAKRMTRLVIEFMLPFGIILYLYLFMVTMNLQIISYNHIISVCFSLTSLFIFSTLGAEIVYNIIREKIGRE